METNRLASDSAYQSSVGQPSTVDDGQVPNGHAYTVSRWNDDRGDVVQEYN